MHVRGLVLPEEQQENREEPFDTGIDHARLCPSSSSLHFCHHYPAQVDEMKILFFVWRKKLLCVNQIQKAHLQDVWNAALMLMTVVETLLTSHH
mmetsp:Transcript_1521/g.2459  ORF Transcript_1521/g.2459 Transcript_1521/m.2459 type:complete len:94 (+) Transcript_1521:219-500(+)